MSAEQCDWEQITRSIAWCKRCGRLRIGTWKERSGYGEPYKYREPPEGGCKEPEGG